MPQLVLTKAKKILKPLKGFLYGPTHSGKTYSSLLIANGMVQHLRNCTEEEAYKHIVLIDTEYGRGALYNKLGEYFYVSFPAPYDTDTLVDYIQQLNANPDIDVIIIDSMTHFWSKKGGILDEKTKADKDGGNSYTNWQQFTAKFNSMIDVLMESPKHALISARAKTDTALIPDDKGKMVPRTFGLKPELREGFEFECDFTFNVDKSTHNLIVEKGIPGMEAEYTPATPDLGKLIMKLHTDNAVAPVRTRDNVIDSIRRVSKDHNLIQFVMLRLSGHKLEELTDEELIKLEVDILLEVKKKQINKHA